MGSLLLSVGKAIVSNGSSLSSSNQENITLRLKSSLNIEFDSLHRNFGHILSETAKDVDKFAETRTTGTDLRQEPKMDKPKLKQIKMKKDKLFISVRVKDPIKPPPDFKALTYKPIKIPQTSLEREGVILGAMAGLGSYADAVRKNILWPKAEGKYSKLSDILPRKSIFKNTEINFFDFFDERKRGDINMGLKKFKIMLGPFEDYCRYIKAHANKKGIENLRKKMIKRSREGNLTRGIKPVGGVKLKKIKSKGKKPPLRLTQKEISHINTQIENQKNTLKAIKIETNKIEIKTRKDLAKFNRQVEEGVIRTNKAKKEAHDDQTQRVKERDETIKKQQKKAFLQKEEVKKSKESTDSIKDRTLEHSVKKGKEETYPNFLFIFFNISFTSANLTAGL